MTARRNLKPNALFANPGMMQRRQSQLNF